MECLKKRIIKYVYPPYWLIIILTPLSIIYLCLTFTNDWNLTVFNYVSYMISFYTLVVFIINAREMYRILRKRLVNSMVYNKINNHPLGNRFLNDLFFRGKISLYQGMFMNILYAAFKLVISQIYQSVWFGAVAAYYIFLSVIRFILLRYVKKATLYENNNCKLIHEFRGYRICGYLLFVLNIVMMEMVIQMVWYNQGYEYPGYIIYISAFYSFYCLTTSIRSLVKFRKFHSPVLSATKTISFSGALMSILALQTAMISQFGGDDSIFRRTMNSLTGGGVCLIVFGTAIFMIVEANRNLKRLQINTLEP
jgi:hypothetical protein